MEMKSSKSCSTCAMEHEQNDAKPCCDCSNSNPCNAKNLHKPKK
jgi:hypothetical protein